MQYFVVQIDSQMPTGKSKKASLCFALAWQDNGRMKQSKFIVAQIYTVGGVWVTNVAVGYQSGSVESNPKGCLRVSVLDP